MYGKIIRDLRKDKNLTQYQLADILKTSRRNISKYELEQLDLSTEMIKKICEYFQVSADYLLGLKEE